MGRQLVWQDRYNIGVKFIDEEHKKLFSILNRLFDYRKQDEKSQWVCQEGIKYFKDHAMKHFTEEEAYMASINYVGFDTHRRLHDNFRKKTLPELEKELNQSNYSEDAINHFLGVCAGWLIGHTLTEDRAITGMTLSKWRELVPEDEQAAMKQTILQLLHDMFLLDAKAVSECYSGEKFGEGIYYRLVYGNSQGDVWEIFLVFEERLIVSTVGSMMDTESNMINVMLMNAARYMAQQFVNQVKGRFSASSQYEMKEENLLTYEQFQSMFDERHFQFSVLFSTGAGYFAYCVTAPHLLLDGDETSIKAENAMEEIKKYLSMNEPKSKKKVLVVDDSEIVRQAMKKMLDKDYTVTLANSGLAAIRCITLNRPDLVLLDYEMPVCDGRQVLEMIRSEKEFADIPVVFLTGRMDKESIQKVVGLKPMGYLLKTSGPEEIKKSVDGFLKA